MSKSVTQFQVEEIVKEKAGYKVLKGQFCRFPFIGNLFFGDKKDLLIPEKDDELSSLRSYLSGNRNKYKQFIRQKSRYPSFDIYASFQPFNEAFKALYPFVEYIKTHLQTGDSILNLWDRSGWTASMLAGWFPEQKIITVWEGDKDILGYRGFDHWMSPERRKNHTVLFADFYRPLPLENASVGAVIALDLLHRFNQPELLTEIHRIAKPNAPILFPHVHLTNSMPEPFFERGCRQLHGTDYQQLFNTLAPETNRTGYILSEPKMFEWNDLTTETERTFVSEPANPDYNACIAWLPTETTPPVLRPWRGHEQDGWEQMYLLQNPLLSIDHVSHTIQLRDEGLGYNIPEFLTRHAVYGRRIEKSIGRSVEEEEMETVLYWAQQGMDLQQIRQRTGISRSKLQQLLEKAWETDLAQVVPVDETGFRSQTLLGQQQYLPETREKNLNAFWKQAVAFYANEPWSKTPDEEALTYTQADELITFVQKALQAEGIKKGDRILLCGELHTEQLLMFWAAVCMGIIVVPVSPNQAPDRLREYVALIQPSLILAQPSLFTTFQENGTKVIMTDEQDDPHFAPEHAFENWLEAGFEQELIPFPEPRPEDEAIILWTTGSTGNSKGIPLTHFQLIRSGRLMTETYHWKRTDRYYALGGLDMMSALRHATVSVAEVGACCVIPVKNENIYDHLQTILKEQITILTANPAFFKQLLLSARNETEALKRSIRLALCTGNQLSMELRQNWSRQIGIPLYNYYGLTETSGICIAEPLRFENAGSNSIGYPSDCLIRIIDENGENVQPGQPGELCIYGAGVFKGYFNNTEATSKALINGWFHTGDTVVQDPDGRVELFGRISDIIKLPAGNRIELKAIEEIMQTIPDLQDWAVCPVREWEKEYFAVFLVLREPVIGFEGTAALIKQEITDRIGAFALPGLIGSVSAIPRGNHHKVLRKELLANYFNSIQIS